MREEIGQLLKISSELDEVNSVDILQEWYSRESEKGPSGAKALKALLGAFDEGLQGHFSQETKYLKQLSKEENLRSLAQTFLKDHSKFLNELCLIRDKLNELMSEKKETAEKLESWKGLCKELKDILEKVGNHAISEEDVIFKLSHNL